MGEDKQKIHINKSIPITILVTMAINLFGVIWYASGIESRIRSLEKVTANNQVVIERLVRVETRMEGLTKAIERLLNR